MTDYIITIAHHSIRRAPETRISGTLLAAKRKATEVFGDSYHDYEILIYDSKDPDHPVARRRIGDKAWSDRTA